MRGLLIYNDLGNAMYTDVADGRMIALPLNATQLVLQEQYEEQFRMVRAGNLAIAFEEHESITFLLASDEGESELLMRHQLHLAHEFVMFLFGKTVWNSMVRDKSRTLQMHQKKKLRSVFDAMRGLCEMEQSFGVQCVEQVDVNEDIRAKAHRTLEVAMSCLPSSQHALLFVGTKLLSHCTRSRAFELSNTDKTVISMHAHSLFCEPSPSASTTPVDAEAQNDREGEEQEGGGEGDGGGEEYDDGSRGPSGFRGGSLLSEDEASHSQAGDEFPAGATPTDRDHLRRMRHRRRARTTKTSRRCASASATRTSSAVRGGSARDSVGFAAASGAMVAQHTFLARALRPNGTALDYDSDTTHERPISRWASDGSVIAGAATLSRVASMPNLGQMDSWEADLQLPHPRPGAGGSVGGGRAARHASSRRSRSEIEGSAKQSSGLQQSSPIEAQSSDLRVVYLQGANMQGTWMHTSEIAPTLRLVLLSTQSPTQETEDVMEGHEQARTYVRQELSAFTEFIVMKGRTHITMMSFITDFPGLVHFVFVDRTRQTMLAPTIVSLHHPVSTAAESMLAPESIAFLRKSVRQLLRHGHDSLMRGCFSSLCKVESLQYSHRLWFETPDGDELPFDRPLPSMNNMQLDTWLQELPRRLFPAYGKTVKIYELFTLYTAGMSYRAVSASNRRLAVRLFQELK